MQRVRMSLPYFKDYGWEAEIVTVDPIHSDLVKDPLLVESIPEGCKVQYVSAFSKKLTSKAGLGSISLRSLWFYKRKVNELLRSKHYDLIYFSTTQFPVCILGPYWKKKFKVPYIIDMQDPWHSEYYKNKPKSQRPRKYWFSYHFNKMMEPIAMSQVDGIISVSDAYIENLKKRYERISTIPTKTITFGYFLRDFEVAEQNNDQIYMHIKKESQLTYIIYVGRGGYDMQPAVRHLFTAFKELLTEEFGPAKQLRFYFIGTSYAPNAEGKPTFFPIAQELDIESYVKEYPERISFYESIKLLKNADGLVVPGSKDPAYTASKIYPYILANKPLLCIFQRSSSIYHILTDNNAGTVADLNDKESALRDIKHFLREVSVRNIQVDTDWNKFKEYSAERMTEQQCDLFNRIIC